jgi:hypothetical protein
MQSKVELRTNRPQSWSNTHQTYETTLDFPLLDILLPLYTFESSELDRVALSLDGQMPHCAMHRVRPDFCTFREAHFG